MSAGLDSLGSVEFANVLAQKLGMQMPGTLVFDSPSVRAVTDFLAVGDVGCAINRGMCEAQFQGAVQMGIGYALYEHVDVDAAVAVDVGDLDVDAVMDVGGDGDSGDSDDGGGGRDGDGVSDDGGGGSDDDAMAMDVDSP